jgi:thioester reductase-like protein
LSATAGDLTLPNLGLNDAAREALCDTVNIVLHCAALIELEADVHKTLT